MFSGQVVAPVECIEQRECKGEEDPGDHVNLLGLEVEVSVPLHQRVGPPGRGLAVYDGARGRGGGVVLPLPPSVHCRLLKLKAFILTLHSYIYCEF